MLSLIICSREADISLSLKENIRETIGIQYELIVIDNSKNKYSIFSAYNEGVRRAKYPYLCFMHDDILFHTHEWGEKIIKHFDDPKLGIIGVVGSHYMPKLPGAHWSAGISSGNIIHTIDDITKKEFWRFYGNKINTKEAICLDGCWLCIPSKLFLKIRFDEFTFSGFHCYDTDICLQIVNLNYKVNIIFDIDIEHFSLGQRNHDWLNNIFLLYHKWKKKLPLNSIKLSKFEISKANFLNAKELIEQISFNKFGEMIKLRIWIYYLKANPPNSKVNILLLFRLINEKLYLFLKKIFQSE